MGSTKLKEKLHQEGVEITLDEATQYINNWRKQFANAARWLDKESSSAQHGKIPQTIFGRKRRFVVIPGEEWKIRNEAKNFKVQSVASDLTLKSLLEIDKQLVQKKLDARIINTVHDSIVLEVREGLETEIQELCLGIMEQGATKLMSGIVPMKADCDVGSNYAFVD